MNCYYCNDILERRTFICNKCFLKQHAPELYDPKFKEQDLVELEMENASDGKDGAGI